MGSEKQMSPAEKEARQMIADKKADQANEAAYNAASSIPVAKPAVKPAVKPAEKPMMKPAEKRSPAVEEAIQEVQDAKMRKKISDLGFSGGGKVGSASSRADGIAQRGKTRGKIC
jgi:hypothetical protein